MMSDINAKLTFVTGMHCDAALVEIESNSKDMVSDDIYDCGVYDWIAYNLEVEIPKNSMLTINVNVSPSYWGDSIDEINYAVVGSIEIKPINNHDRLQQENAELREAFKELKSIAMQEREWRLEDLEVGHCEVQESMDTLSYRIDKLLNKND
ncbi:coil containing protein [Vibrio phage 1.225.O._10N.261.48.B7]|nr:coil containing protein [Vibrio phage 1.225.O._10N.261.48.B7]